MEKGVEIKMKHLTLQQQKELMSILQNVEPWTNPQQLKEQVILWMKKEAVSWKNVQIQGNVRQAKLIILFEDMDMWIADRNTESWEKLNYNMADSVDVCFSYPKVVLVNLCDVSLRPVPRLNLSTAVIASYLRKKHAAEVTIIDMQMGVSIAEVVDICEKVDPALIGMSVDFKEYDLAEQLLMELEKRNVQSTKVLGNILPSLLYKKFLENHPEILISYGEGEESWYDLAMWVAGKLSFHEISGLRYLEQGEIRTTPVRYIDMKDCQTPALDTLPELVSHGGILTLETSRGCDYSACSFCPREHKTCFWRGMPSDVVVNQLQELVEAADRIGLPRHIYLADEEIIGELADGSEYRRIAVICEELIRKKVNCTMNASVRADSLYNPKKGIEKSEEMIHAWKLFHKAGLEKLFIGVESGSEGQLMRYGKGTTPRQNIIAIRIATALGIKVRIGFVMFDPLMEDRSDLLYNMQFLSRKDAIMKTFDSELSERELLSIVEERSGSLVSFLANKPIYMFVSYLFTGLEVFVKAPYYKKVKKVEREKQVALIGDYDWELGKVKTAYINSEIGELQSAFARWVDKNYSLTYTLKSLAKSAEKEERDFLYNKVFEYRNLLYEMAICILLRDDVTMRMEAIKTGRKYGIDIGTDILGIMNQWEKAVMDPYLDSLKQETMKWIECEANRKLIFQIIAERSRVPL